MDDAFGNNVEEDPAAEFLAREQANLAGIDDELAAVDQQFHQNGVDDVLASGDPPVMRNGPSVVSEPREEPEKIRKWREDQKKMIEQKDADEEVKKKELREQASKELEEWYQRYRDQIAKSKQANRNAEKEYVCEGVAKGEEWEGIAKLCDFNPKSTRHTKDISRMKTMLLQLKQQPPSSSNVSKA